MVFWRQRALLLAAVSTVCLQAVAGEVPVRTWGPYPDPPPPPPVTQGEPVSGAKVSEPDPRAPAEAGGEPSLSSHAVGGLRYTVESVLVRGNRTTLSRVVLRYVPFHAGDSLDVDDKELMLTRFRLLGTGYFRDVRLSLERGKRRGFAVLVVNVEERNTIVVNDLWLGLSADASPTGVARPLTAYGGAHVSENNLGGTGIALGGAFAVADRQLALRTRFTDPQFLRTSLIAEGELLYSAARDFFGNRDVHVDDPNQNTAQDYAVLRYRRFGGALGAGHDVGHTGQLFVHYRLEKIDVATPLAASHTRGFDIVPIEYHLAPGGSVLSSVRTTFVHDTRNVPVLTTSGEHLVLGVDAGLLPLGSSYAYTKMEAHGTTFHEYRSGHVLALRAFLGGVFGDAPLFERYYVGDFSDLLPDRVLELNVDRRPAPNFFRTAIAEVRYGTYAAKVSAEYRIPVYRGTRSVYGVDFFSSVGLYSVANPRDIQMPARGYRGLSVVPIDLTFNAGLRFDTQAGAVALGLSSFLGFLPVRGDNR